MPRARSPCWIGGAPRCSPGRPQPEARLSAMRWTHCSASSWSGAVRSPGSTASQGPFRPLCTGTGSPARVIPSARCTARPGSGGRARWPHGREPAHARRIRAGCAFRRCPPRQGGEAARRRPAHFAGPGRLARQHARRHPRPARVSSGQEPGRRRRGPAARPDPGGLPLRPARAAGRPRRGEDRVARRRDPGQASAHAGRRGRLRAGADGDAGRGRAGRRTAPGRHRAARCAARRERKVLVLHLPGSAMLPG